MRSLKRRMTVWFAGSVLGVVSLFSLVTYLHLRHELRFERWERTDPAHADWSLHGSYSESEVADIAGELLRLSLLYIIPATIIAVAIGYLIARRSMANVDRLNQQLADIEAKNLAKRICLPAADEELRAVESHINALLGRLEKSFEQLNEYSATVAHELRTPLTLIRLKMDDVAGQLDPESAESIQEELARLTDYVDQSLLLARAEQGRLAIHLSEIEIRPFLEEMLEGYVRWAAQEGRNLTTEIEDGCRVSSDRRYLKQILHNLMTNAVKHGLGPIDVCFRRTEQGSVCRVRNLVKTKTETKTLSGTGRGMRIAEVLSQRLGVRFETKLIDSQYYAELVWTNVHAEGTLKAKG